MPADEVICKLGTLLLLACLSTSAVGLLNSFYMIYSLFLLLVGSEILARIVFTCIRNVLYNVSVEEEVYAIRYGNTCQQCFKSTCRQAGG